LQLRVTPRAVDNAPQLTHPILCQVISFYMLSVSLNLIPDAVHNAVQDMLQVMNPYSGRDMRNIGLLVAALVCAILPLEISHLLSAIFGVAAYLMFQALQPHLEPSPTAKKGVPSRGHCHSRWSGSLGHPLRDSSSRINQYSSQAVDAAMARSTWSTSEVSETPRHDVRKPSAMPVVAPTFKAHGWEEEVQELLRLIAPSPEADATVAEIARTVSRAIAPVLPEAEVSGFANGSLTNRVAFGVAVPEVDIVISVSPSALMGGLQGRWTQARGAAVKLDARKLQKSAIRACTDRLVGTSAFKFRRSAFRGQEPKVTMIAPSPCNQGRGVPVNISVNAVTPLYNAALITECGQMEPRAKELVLLVKRWAKDRGLCHAAKGHLSPYAWTLLAIFFMQAGIEEPLLPPLEFFQSSSGLMKKFRSSSGLTKKSASTVRASQQLRPRHASRNSVGSLFKEFIVFYAREFNWQEEAVSVCLGHRGPPDVSLPLHIIVQEDGQSTVVGPSIEDPFEDSQNIGECMTAASLIRLHEELDRADRLCSQPEVSLTTLLEPWAPPEHEASAGQCSGEHEDQDKSTGASCI